MMRYLGRKVVSHGTERNPKVKHDYYFIVINSRGRNPTAYDVLVFVEHPENDPPPYSVAHKNDVADLSEAIRIGRKLARTA